MKSIINKLLYDTSKSEMLHCNNLTGMAIYLTPNKRLFITVCDCITTADQENCKEYLGKVFPDKYIELFGEVEDA